NYALDAANREQPAHVCDVGRLRRPRRDRAEARRDVAVRVAELSGRRGLAVLEQTREYVALRRGQFAVDVDQVEGMSADAADGGRDVAHASQQLLDTEIREGEAAAEPEHPRILRVHAISRQSRPRSWCAAATQSSAQSSAAASAVRASSGVLF